MDLFFAQIKDDRAGRLDAAGAKGGPENVFLQPFTSAPTTSSSPTFTRKVFDIYDAWAVYDQRQRPRRLPHDRGARRARARRSIAARRSSTTSSSPISGVPGFNDVMARTTVMGTCSTCHNVPNIGGHAVFRMMDIGTAEAGELRSAPAAADAAEQDRPIETRMTCDMGRGGNGIWADLGKFRVAAAAWSGGARAVLPRRPGEEHRRGRPLLPEALQHGDVAPPARRPGSVPRRPVNTASLAVQSALAPSGSGGVFYVLEGGKACVSRGRVTRPCSWHVFADGDG